MVSKEEINELIAATDMVALVSPYVKLTKSGSGYKGLCPFHQEDTPSFHVSQEKHIAKCFGCGEGGSPISFLMKIKNINFEQAVLELAKINNFKLKTYKVDPFYEQNKKFYEMNKIALELFERNLTATLSGEKALDYLHKRGLDDETIKEFDIGLAPKDNVLYNLLKSNNYLELDMVNANLVNNINGNYVDVFKDRIIFTIRDENDNIVAFSGREYHGVKDQAKYINSSETNIFKKHLILYNLNNAIKYIKENNRVVIFEGFMDVIAASRSNIKESVCTMGTALTKGHIKLLKKYTNNIVLAFDNDKAGKLATKRAITLLEAEGFNVYIFELKDAKDADEYVLKYSKEKFYELFNTSLISAIDFYYKNVMSNANLNDINSIEIVKDEIFNYLRTKKSNLIINKYLQKLSIDLKVDFNVLSNDFNHIKVEDIYDDNVVVIKNKPKEEVKEYAEYRLFYYAFRSKQYANYIDDKLSKNNCYKVFSKNLSKLWLFLIDTFYKKYDILVPAKFVEELKGTDLIEDYIRVIKEIEKFQEILPAKDSTTDLDSTIDKFISLSDLLTLNDIQNMINKSNDEKLKEALLIKKFQILKKKN